MLSNNNKNPQPTIVRTTHITRMGSLRVPVPKKNRKIVRRTLAALGLLLLKAPYALGSFLLSLVMFFVRGLLSEFSATRYSLVRRIAAVRRSEFKTSLVAFIFLALVSFGLLKSASLIAYGTEIKGKVLGIAKTGQQHLKDAEAALRAQDFQRAQSELLRAQDSFEHSRQELEQANASLNSILNLLPQKHDADNLIDASALLSKAGHELLLFHEQASKMKVTQSGVEALGASNSEVITAMYYHLSNASFSVSEAEKSMMAVNPSSVPEAYRDQVVFLKDNISSVSKSLKTLEGLYGLLKNILMGDKRVLFVFQNNNELRATGGFIGTFGSARMKDGKIEQLHISSIYDLDGQLEERIAPPSPMLYVNERWYLRDSNWFADFPTSAKKITSFYEKEGGETPDLIIAINAGVVQELLRLTGPVEMPSYGLTLNSENFIETTQAATVMDESAPVNTPKQMLADFFPVLLQRLSDMDAAQAPALLEVFNQSLSGKHILVYAKDRETQRQLSSYNWTGELYKTDRDFLSVVSSNLGGTKTDVYIDQDMELKSVIGADGSIVNTLSVTRKNKLPESEKYVNSSFMRVYVPEGSKLLSAEGFDYRSVIDPKIVEKSKKDSLVAEWERSLERNVVTGTYTGTESGKTIFGNWVELKGGESQTFTVTYKLPFKLKDIDRHSLLLQKQPGSRSGNVMYTVEFGSRKLEWLNFPAQDMQTQKFVAQSQLNKDYFWGMVFGRTSE